MNGAMNGVMNTAMNSPINSAMNSPMNGAMNNPMNTGKAPICLPTWQGHIETTKDALIIFEACFAGHLAHCFRRPHDRERNSLIVSGNVFVYEEATSGIKRWTDGIPWSPSRILTNFLIYRQLNNPFPPGEKKRATKRGQRPTKPGDPYPSPGTSKGGTGDETYQRSPVSPSAPAIKSEESLDKDANRGLLGSLIDSYEFKEDGLLKKTMTVVIKNVQHHLVSYYSLEDAKHNLRTPRDDPLLQKLELREELLHQPKFKFPNIDDAGDGAYDQMDGALGSYGYYGYDHPRHLSVVSKGHAVHQDPASHMYYQGMGQYVSQPLAHNSLISYASAAPAYTPMVVSAAYAQHQSRQAQEPIHGAASQSGHHHQVQNLGHAHPELQTHHPTQVTHHTQSFQHLPQYSSSHSSPHGPTPQTPYSDHPVPSVNYASHLPHCHPRTTAPFDFMSSSPDHYSPMHEYYTSLPGLVPMSEHSGLLPQPWQSGSGPAAFQSRGTPTTANPVHRAMP